MQALIKPTGISVIGAAIRTCLSLVSLPILTVVISLVLKVSYHIYMAVLSNSESRGKTKALSLLTTNPILCQHLTSDHPQCIIELSLQYNSE